MYGDFSSQSSLINELLLSFLYYGRTDLASALCVADFIYELYIYSLHIF